MIRGVVITFCFVLVLVSCSPTLPLYQLKFAGQRLTVPSAMFENSSVTLVRDNQAKYDILLVKRTPTGFEGLLLNCTYKDHPLVLAGDSIRCSAHACVYSFNGEPVRGPATTSLMKFPATYDEPSGNVDIDITALGL